MRTSRLVLLATVLSSMVLGGPARASEPVPMEEVKLTLDSILNHTSTSGAMTKLVRRMLDNAPVLDATEAAATRAVSRFVGDPSTLVAVSAKGAAGVRTGTSTLEIHVSPESSAAITSYNETYGRGKDQWKTTEVARTVYLGKKTGALTTLLQIDGRTKETRRRRIEYTETPLFLGVSMKTLSNTVEHAPLKFGPGEVKSRSVTRWLSFNGFGKVRLPGTRASR